MKLLIQNGRVVDPSQKLDAPLDVLVEDGKIKAIEKPGAFAAVKVDQTFDAKNCVVAPGFIDAHVHLREPGLEYKETIASGTLAALHGGFTSVTAMANTKPVNDDAIVTQYILQKAREAGNARVFPIGAVTKGMKGEELAEIGMMVEAGAKAISDDGLPIMNAYLMRRAMEYARTFDIPVISHAEDLNLSQAGTSSGAPMNEGAVSSLLGYRGNPNASEEIMVSREIALARLTGAKVHIAHLSTKEGIEHVKRAKEAGLSVTAEVTPHHLMMNDQFILSGKHTCVHHQARSDYKMAPPLRSEADQAALLDALNQGVIDMIGSDHAPHGCVDKEVEFELAANGILGLQTTIPLMLDLVHTNQLSLQRMIESVTTAPAKLLQLHGLGTLKPGSFADITILDLKKEWTLTPAVVASKSKNSPFLGRNFKGAVRATFVEGKLKYEC